MTKKTYRIPLFTLLNCLSDVMDWVSPLLVHHHKQVALISLRLAEELNLPKKVRDDLVMAGMVHDIGAISLAERMDTLAFETTTGHSHAQMGFFLLQIFEPLIPVATIVRFHHVYWHNGDGQEHYGEKVPEESHIIHLADRISLLINAKREILGQSQEIRRKIVDYRNVMFPEKLVEAFISVSRKESFWLDAASPMIEKIIERSTCLEDLILDADGLLSFANLFRRIIDFRSPFTATHSSGVAASAESLAKISGFSPEECHTIKVAGYLHDLGKLAVPTEILEKPGKLTTEEFNIMRCHTFYTYRTLEPLVDLQTVNLYGSFHHERMDGGGYPFHLSADELPLGSRILAVADVFTALTEDRPYRKGMKPDDAFAILREMSENGKLNPPTVQLLREHFSKVNEMRQQAQQDSIKEYRHFLEQLL